MKTQVVAILRAGSERWHSPSYKRSEVVPPSSPKVHFVYRTVAAENRKGRPPWYTKAVCLASFLEAVSAMQQPAASLLVVCDSPELPEGCEDVLGAYGHLTPKVEHTAGLGNGGTYLKALETLACLDGREYFYLSEDDYLYRSTAFQQFVDAASSLPEADYLALYDHPDRYHREDDRVIFARRPVAVTNSAHWRMVESTCSTFGGRLAALKADAWLHRYYFSQGTYVRDRRLWRALQSPLRGRNRRRVYSVVPSQASHQETEVLAPLVDWDRVAFKANAAAEQRKRCSVRLGDDTIELDD